MLLDTANQHHRSGSISQIELAKAQSAFNVIGRKIPIVGDGEEEIHFRTI